MLTPSVITSFDPRGFLHEDFVIPEYNLNGTSDAMWLDLYCFMGYDLRRLCQSNENHLECLKHLSLRNKDWEEVCDSAVAELKERMGGAGIAAFASFIPEITHWDDKIRRIAVNHIAFLVHLLDRLTGGLVEGRPPTLEIVAGSKFGRVYPVANGEVCKGNTKPTDYFIELRGQTAPADPSCPIEHLVSSLQEIIAKTKGSNVRFAVEMEVGAKYVLGCLDELNEFIERIEENGLSERVGLNLDTGHWSMLELEERGELPSPQRVEEIYFPLLKHVVHAHASYQRRGHFGDLMLGSQGSLEAIRPWVAVLSKIKDGELEDKGIPADKFDGFISLEMEAAASRETVERSFNNLTRLIKEPYQAVATG